MVAKVTAKDSRKKYIKFIYLNKVYVDRGFIETWLCALLVLNIRVFHNYSFPEISYKYNSDYNNTRDKIVSIRNINYIYLCIFTFAL